MEDGRIDDDIGSKIKNIAFPVFPPSFMVKRHVKNLMEHDELQAPVTDCSQESRIECDAFPVAVNRMHVRIQGESEKSGKAAEERHVPDN